MKKCKKCKKYLKFLPHVVISIIVLMAAIPKIIGADMSVELFNNLNLFGQPELSRLAIGIGQLLLVVLLFKKCTEKYAAFLLAVNMLGAFLLVTVHAQAVVVLVLCITILFRKCGTCKKGICTKCTTKECESCDNKECEGLCTEEKKEDSSE